MNESFISYSHLFTPLLEHVIANPCLHAKWLNTLSYLENSGARKIAACEHPTLVKEEMLKHAADEFRHAHYLKKQIQRTGAILSFPDYSLSHILGGLHTLHYLHALDAKTCRYLKTHFPQKGQHKAAAYILVTYAIELRAQELYPGYDALLRKKGSKVTVKSIALEEEEHLREMRREMELVGLQREHLHYACTIEASLCSNWLIACQGQCLKSSPAGPQFPA